MKFIPVYEPLFKGNEEKYLRQCIRTGWVSSEGEFVRRFEEAFAKWAGTRYAVAVCNGTAALETALWSLNLPSGKIYTHTGTIISCALVILRLGYELCFFDDVIYESNFKFTKAIINSNLFGCRQKHDDFSIPVIDDCSQYWKPIKVKDVACYSLYANKLITSGEGGILATNHKNIYERARLYRNLSHSKERFIHNEMGYNFRMSNLQGAVALAQLEQIDKFIAIKQKNRDLYKKYLPKQAVFLADVEVPWMYLVETSQDAGKMVKRLGQKGIDCRRFFYPLHKQPCFKGRYEDQCFPNADYAWSHLFYLPSGLTLTEAQIKYICQNLKNTLNTTT